MLFMWCLAYVAQKSIDVKNVKIKIKNVENVTKREKNLCKRNQKRYLFLV